MLANFIVCFDQVVLAADHVVSRTVSVSLVIIMIHMQTQVLVYDILPPTAAITDYAIGCQLMNSFSLVLKWQ